MKYELNTVTIGEHTGYGNASRLFREAMEGRGWYDQPGSPIVINFCMPIDYKFSEFTIGYTPWESTEVPVDWIEPMQKVDKLWSTSDWSSRILGQIAGRHCLTVRHGIEECWAPAKRYRNGKFKFIHVGDPAIRKGGDLVLDAWLRAFSTNKDVELIYKCIKYPVARVKDKSGSIIASPGMFDNITIRTNVMTQEELWSLYYQSNCMVYPSRGEGFGLIPFEAMGTGLPTILPNASGMEDYAWLSPLPLRNFEWVDSGEDLQHPGKWLNISVDEIIHLMQNCMDDYDNVAERSFINALELHSCYSWDHSASDAIMYLTGIL